MRVVLDTNILVSGVLTRRGNESRILNLAFDQKFTLIVSEAVSGEYEEVLHRPELKLSSEEVTTVLAAIHRVGERVEPSETVAVSKDEDDNRFLECAEAGAADYLVTGNKRHFPAKWKSTRIVNARQLLELVSPEADPR